MDVFLADVLGLDMGQTMGLEISATLEPHSLIPLLLFGACVSKVPRAHRSPPTFPRSPPWQ